MWVRAPVNLALWLEAAKTQVQEVILAPSIMGLVVLFCSGMCSLKESQKVQILIIVQ